MSVAEVIERNGRHRLRLGFRGDEGVLADAPVADLEEGSFVAVDTGPDGAVRVVRDAGGDPVVVAAAGTALADVHRIAARAGLDTGYPEAAAAEAAEAVRGAELDDPALVDLTAMPFVTIDYRRSRDLDQALYIEARGESLVIWYALADAAYFVRPGGALFAEALRRGASYYLPGLTVPMLPRSLSEGMTSLNEEQLRRALVFEMVIAPGGEVASSTLHRARIRSRAKLTYHGVQAYLDAPSSSQIRFAEFAASLDLLPAVGERRIAYATDRDVVRFDRVACDVSLPAPDAHALLLERDERDGVERWNEQISLVTNIVGARLLAERGDGLFRVHPGPSPSDLEAFARSVESLVDTLGLDPSWRWRRGAESLADYVARLPPGRLSQALQRQAMVMGRPSFYAREPAPHFGVGASAYSRFSSPMREIVGIATHHIALAERAGKSPADVGLTDEVLERVIESGNRSRKVQKDITRAADKLAIDQLFAAELERPAADRPRRRATVMGVTATKIYVQLDDPPIDLKLYVADQERLLGGAMRPKNHFELAGPGDRSIRIGDEVAVRLESYSRRRDRWILELLD